MSRTNFEEGLLAHKSLILGWIQEIANWKNLPETLIPVYVSTSSIRFNNIDLRTIFPNGTKIKFTQLSIIKYFIVKGQQYSSGHTTLILDGGISFTVANSTISDFAFSDAAVADGMPFGSCVFVPLNLPIIPAAWNGVSKSTTVKTLIDLSAVFGLPEKIKAVYVRVFIRDSGSSGSSAVYFLLSPNNNSGVGSLVVRTTGLPNDAYAEGTGIVPCNSNGDIYFQCVATGTNTLDIFLQVWGYWL